ncbi:MAG: Mitochondrial outer membrane protein iml2 [Sclerophora amabilis]|nr:MAG: Mitochondrial outer membrane protein iml2 [Sclerophora amabilis]
MTPVSTASERLADAEATAANDHRRAQKESQAYHSAIYPVGSEFALVHAECQIMSAVVGVLNESLTESIKGFYKLRKAFMTLDAILEAENHYMKGPSPGSLQNSSTTSLDSAKGVMPGGFGDEKIDNRASSKVPTVAFDAKGVNPPRVNQDVPQNLDQVPAAVEEDDDDDDFFDADESHGDTSTTSKYLGRTDAETPRQGLDDRALPGGTTSSRSSFPTQLALSNHTTIDHNPDSQFFANPIDMFIHSGSNLCFGLLLILISMIPPVFSKLLYIIGFRGDRERGINLLWQASKFHNINGGLAGLILLGYYNGLVGFCDILPDEDDENLEGYPRKRCELLLADMRTRYPKSHLWKLEDARMQAANRKLTNAIQLLSTDTKSPLKQVEALAMFEKSLNAMYSHRYELTAESFLECVKLNNWSHGLYYYIAGSAYLELYRKEKAHNPSQAKQYAKKAEKLLKDVPNHTGKKKFMARQLPFDLYVFRKIQKWKQRAHEWGIDFVDAVGVSPIEEMLFFWNGYKRMSPTELQDSLDALAWSKDINPHWHREGLDEQAIHAFLSSVTVRNLARYSEARQILQEQILSHDRSEFKGHLKDDWTCPSAHYEMAVICWMDRREGGDEMAKVRECGEWLDKAAKWDSYELDTRIGLKITTAEDTLKKYRLQGSSSAL